MTSEKKTAKAVRHPDGFLVLGRFALVAKDVTPKTYSAAKAHAMANNLEVRFVDVPTEDLDRPNQPSWKDRIRNQMNEEEQER